MAAVQNLSVLPTQSYDSAGTQGQQSLQAFANLDLSEAQRTQIRSIFASAKQNGIPQSEVQNQVDAVLTLTQQQSLGGH